MSDNIDKKSYNFPGNESKEKYSMSPFGGTESLKSIFKNKRFMKSFGSIFLFYLIMQGVIYMFSNNTENVEEEPVVVSQKEVVNIPDTEIVQAQNTTNKPVEVDEVHQQELDKVSFDLSEQTLEVKRLKSQIRDLENKQQDLMYNINMLERKFESNIGQITEYIAAQKAKEKAALAAKEAVKKNTVKPKQQFYVTKAVVHGRAWINKKGTNDSISVSVGDTIPTYGKVLMIDVDAGAVHTSSGRKIGFGL